MNNLIFENATKAYFGKGCVKEYLACLAKGYGDTVMLCYGGGSVKKNGVYDEVMRILRAAGKTIIEFSGVSQDIDLRAIADSCPIMGGSYKNLTHDEIFELFSQCL